MLTGVNGLPGCWMVLLYRISQCSLQGLDLTLNETIGLGKVWGRGYMVNVLSLQELGKLFGWEGRAIVSVDEAGWSVLSDEFL